MLISMTSTDFIHSLQLRSYGDQQWYIKMCNLITHTDNPQPPLSLVTVILCIPYPIIRSIIYTFPTVLGTIAHAGSVRWNYCPVTWMFCGRKDVMKLDKLQEHALRFVFKDNQSSYVDLLKRGNFLSLSAFRIKNLAMEVFKCFHGMKPMYLNYVL